jgi:toxin ParE1/3/4
LKLVWSRFAIADREAIYTYIENHNAAAALKVDERIEEACGHLARFPKMGRAGRVEGTRERAINGTPYVVVYRLAANHVLILRILHGAQRWPPGSAA